jgi:hypothetical protein
MDRTCKNQLLHSLHITVYYIAPLSINLLPKVVLKPLVMVLDTGVFQLIGTQVTYLLQVMMSTLDPLALIFLIYHYHPFTIQLLLMEQCCGLILILVYH